MGMEFSLPVTLKDQGAHCLFRILLQLYVRKKCGLKHGQVRRQTISRPEGGRSNAHFSCDTAKDEVRISGSRGGGKGRKEEKEGRRGAARGNKLGRVTMSLYKALNCSLHSSALLEDLVLMAGTESP